jgi:hypothetical protein
MKRNKHLLHATFDWAVAIVCGMLLGYGAAKGIA